MSEKELNYQGGFAVKNATSRLFEFLGFLNVTSLEMVILSRGL